MELAVTNYMHWYGVATFLRCPLVTGFKDVDIGLVGVPYSGGNAIERMQYLGPRAVRNRSSSYRRAHRQFGIDPKRTVQIGIRGPVALLEQDDWAKENFASVITTEDVVTLGVPHVVAEVRRIIGDGPVYLSFDLDALDPAYAPAVADPETDGLTIREVNQMLRGFRGLNFLGGDIVCFCPPMDTPGQITAMTSAAMMLDMVSLIADRHFSK